MKTDHTIALEIALLTVLSELLPPLNDCGLQDNSRKVVAAQIDVLAFHLDSDQVHSAYMDLCPDDMFLDLLHASDWVHDLQHPQSASAPSMQWRDRVKYSEGAELVDQRAQEMLDLAIVETAL